MKPLIALCLLTLCAVTEAAVTPPSSGVASWYGESHRGRLMANGKRFNPDNFTAASWFYPLGTKVRVTLACPELNGKKEPPRTVIVTITDRGPAHRLVRDGRIIDLTHAAFKALAHPDLGLIEISVTPVPRSSPSAPTLAAQASQARAKNRS
jgi:rare lipoprotein A